MARRRFDDDELHWYALDVVRQKEFVAGLIFNKRGWVTFIPTETRFRKKNRYTKSKGLEVAHPEIPGTVFVGFPTAPNWFEVMKIHLVNGVCSPDRRIRRIDTCSRDWLRYRARRLDGQLVLERHKVEVRVEGEICEVERTVPMVRVQGRAAVRAPWHLKSKAGADRPLVITMAGTRAEKLKGMFASAEENMRAA